MSTSDDRFAADRVTDDRLDDDATTAGATSPGPGSTDASARTAVTGGTGQAIPDTGPGPAAADVDDAPDGRR